MAWDTQAVTKPPPWTAERTVDAARAAELVGRAFPHLRDRPVVRLAEGWDNTVHVVDGVWAFRFPRRAIAVPAIRRQLLVLPRIATLLPLPIPVPELVATDDDPLDPWPFAGSRLLPGRELADAALSPEDRVPAAAAVGVFLRVLHAPAARAALGPDLVLPIDPLRRGWPRALIQNTREVLDQLVADEIWDRDPAVEALLAEAERLGPPAGDPVLVHGDLHVRHLLVDDAGAATGVIDWDDACLGDPAIDLALAYAAFSGPARAALLTHYGPVDAEQELRARHVAIRVSAFLASYAATTHRPALLAESRAALRRAVR